MQIIILCLSAVLSFFMTIYGTPLAQKIAFRYNILDVPDGKLKKHSNPVPYMGGVIVYFSFISPIALMFSFSRELLGILFASSILLIVGLFDDLKALTPGIKFLFQIIATYILLKSGIFINLLFLPPWLNTLLSFFWILTAINAMNIIDIMDGLASSTGAAAGITIFIISLYTGNFLISIMSLSLSASLLGFLRFNWQPARIYLGDSGSMLLGLILGALTIMCDYTKFNSFAFVSGFLILGFPFFDIAYVIIVRLIKRKSPFMGSPDHLALRLRKKLKTSSANTVAILLFLQISFSAIALLNFYTNHCFTFVSLTAVVLVCAVFGLWLFRVRMD